jgi:hypothetical protein
MATEPDPWGLLREFLFAWDSTHVRGPTDYSTCRDLVSAVQCTADNVREAPKPHGELEAALKRVSRMETGIRHVSKVYQDDHWLTERLESLLQDKS